MQQYKLVRIVGILLLSINSVADPTGYSPFGQSPFDNVVSTPSPAPSNNSLASNTSPANIFAQMKSGTFASGNEHAVPQQAGECSYIVTFDLFSNS